MMLFSLLLTLAIPQMGFDQDKTVHHFHLYTDGGAIEVNTRDAKDTTERAAVRTHLSHIATMFGEGDFASPMHVHGTKDVPGVAVLTARRSAITYRYAETAAGGRIDIVTTDGDALAALHDFLRYQIREHHTGDPLTIGTRR